MVKYTTPRPDDSLVDELTQLRTECATTYKQNASYWSGKSYATWREYPLVPDEVEATESRTGVMLCDSLLRTLQATRSADGYNMTGRQLADFACLYAAVDSIRVLSPVRPVVTAGLNLRDQRRRGARTTNEAHNEIRDQYQPKVNQLMASGLSYTKACAEVAYSLGVSDRTVREHTVNPTPRNRGKWREETA